MKKILLLFIISIISSCASSKKTEAKETKEIITFLKKRRVKTDLFILSQRSEIDSLKGEIYMKKIKSSLLEDLNELEILTKDVRIILLKEILKECQKEKDSLASFLKNK